MAQASLKALRRQDFKFHLDYRTRWTDNDMYHHMNNSLYYHLFDSIINTYLAKNCAHSPSSSSLIGLVASSRCDYLSPVGFPMVVDLALRVVKLGRSSVTYQIAVFPQEDKGSGAPSAVGEVVHVFVERESMKSGNNGMGEDLRSGLEAISVAEQANL